MSNREIGKFTYFIIHSSILYISYKIWGIKMFEEIYFYLMHLTAFSLTGFVLRKLGIWRY
jgi:hypothetical protein